MWKVFYFPAPGSRRVWGPIFTRYAMEAKARYAREQSQRRRSYVFLAAPDGKPVRYGRACFGGCRL
jgi:hypothetical protein